MFTNNVLNIIIRILFNILNKTRIEFIKYKNNFVHSVYNHLENKMPNFTRTDIYHLIPS